MEIVGTRKFVELPGQKTHELPPLLVRATPEVKRLDRVMNLANALIESEQVLAPIPADDLIHDAEVESTLARRRMDLAVNLVESYLGLVLQWRWGDSILEWIRQCETTFECTSDLRALLRPDVWPHAGRSSFVALLRDKAVGDKQVHLEKAVGLRLTFRQPPPISCFSDQFLFYLNGQVADSAYQAWACMAPEPVSFLPPERFRFDVVDMKM